MCPETFVISKRVSPTVSPFFPWTGRYQEPLNAPFLNGLFSKGFQEGKGPLRYSGKRPIKVGRWPIKEWKRPIKATGQFSGTPKENGPSKKAHEEVYEKTQKE